MKKRGRDVGKRQGKTQRPRKSAGSGKTGYSVKRSAASGPFATVHEPRVQAVMAAADRGGLLDDKSSRIGGRVSRRWSERRKRRAASRPTPV